MPDNNNIEEISMKLIDKNPDNEKIFNMKDIEYLAMGIRDEGFYGAIEVFKKPDGRYEISSGHRRFEAMKYLHREKIPCIVNDMPDDYQIGIKLLSCNLKTRKLTPMDMARSIDYFEKLEKSNGRKGNFSKKAARFFNISESQVYRFQILLKLIPELQELADEPEFPYSALRGAVNLTEEGQKRLYDQLTIFTKIPDRNISDEDEASYKLTRARIEIMIENLRHNIENQARPNIKVNKDIVQKPEDVEHNTFIPKGPGTLILNNSIKPHAEVEFIRRSYIDDIMDILFQIDVDKLKNSNSEAKEKLKERLLSIMNCL